ncbi:MAG: cytidine deaminase [Roseibacillus sp.]|jgi:cytidine deaminase|nr:cytidine deaminase [Roseibacillus sp.]MDP6208131.1 cytidine deaminase [Roseibacillus sp.]MDP7307562.1 cytidine deaminase [Roseibacillus sp.]MDP7494888.1 cytidine deaminase [Roseibacillus sp.]MDP7655387.1 cytidine deaminase [Roseibacillus sp.]|tara:strand:- start:15197 stop:15598 length:402 start_codon:yes stop_codon:yes gene_type:complete
MSSGEEGVLIEAAQAAREQAYAPYSTYQVGSALQTRSGRIYTGCNVENASYGLTICSERVALAKAVSEGERDFDLLAICASGAPAPCGACRQVLHEFSPDLVLLLVDPRKEQSVKVDLSVLLPQAFQQSSLDV